MTDLEQVYSRLERCLIELHEAHAALAANTGDPVQRTLYAYFLDAASQAAREMDRHAPSARGRVQ